LRTSGNLEHILIIGGGTGGALAHDLALRGFRVTLVERGELLSGTSGRHHGLLHSGARYVLHDLETARECYEENQILRRLAPDALEANNGLFVAMDESDMGHRDRFLDRCRQAGIPVRSISAQQALAMEPGLNPAVKTAVEVPDATMDAWRLPLHFFATARANGADIRTFTEVTGFVRNGRIISGVMVVDHRRQRTETIGADIVVNAAGPWAGRVAALADLTVPVRPGPGVMVSVGERLCTRVINRLQPAGEGDIVVPQRGLSIVGTTAWLADDPDAVAVPEGQVAQLMNQGAQLLPRAAELAPHAVWCASRPLLNTDGNEDPMRISRTFDCMDHAPADGVEGLVTLMGGKATTMRAMAQTTADLVCRKTGRDLQCRTRTTKLIPYRHYYRPVPAQ
jgi:glycerol-3-phosphate dehydrogenase